MFILGIVVTALVTSLITMVIIETHRSNGTPSLTLAKHTIDEIRMSAMGEFEGLSERCISRMNEKEGLTDVERDRIRELLGIKQ